MKIGLPHLSGELYNDFIALFDNPHHYFDDVNGSQKYISWIWSLFLWKEGPRQEPILLLYIFSSHTFCVNCFIYHFYFIIPVALYCNTKIELLCQWWSKSCFVIKYLGIYQERLSTFLSSGPASKNIVRQRGSKSHIHPPPTQLCFA